MLLLLTLRWFERPGAGLRPPTAVVPEAISTKGRLYLNKIAIARHNSLRRIAPLPLLVNFGHGLHVSLVDDGKLQ